MKIQVERTYNGGMLVVTDVQVADGGKDITAHEEAVIARYIRLLDEKDIIGDIEVPFQAIELRFGS